MILWRSLPAACHGWYCSSSPHLGQSRSDTSCPGFQRTWRRKSWTGLPLASHFRHLLSFLVALFFCGVWVRRSLAERTRSSLESCLLAGTTRSHWSCVHQSVLRPSRVATECVRSLICPNTIPWSLLLTSRSFLPTYDADWCEPKPHTGDSVESRCVQTSKIRTILCWSARAPWFRTCSATMSGRRSDEFPCVVYWALCYWKNDHGVLVKWGQSFLVATTRKNIVGDRKSAVFVVYDTCRVASLVRCKKKKLHLWRFPLLRSLVIHQVRTACT